MSRLTPRVPDRAMRPIARTTVRGLGVFLIFGVVALMTLAGAPTSAASRGAAASPAIGVAAPNEASSPPIAVGGDHVCALPGDGTVLCWGGNTFGQLGNGSITDPNAPAGDVELQQIVIADAASASGGNCVDVVADGSVVRCHGSASLTGVTAIAAGFTHTCALLGDATVKCWGSNAAVDGGQFGVSQSGGELGDGTTVPRPAPVAVVAAPTETAPLSDVRALSAANRYTGAVLADGSARCWGDTPQGASLAPVAVMADATHPLMQILSISAGYTSACALLAD